MPVITAPVEERDPQVEVVEVSTEETKKPRAKKPKAKKPAEKKAEKKVKRGRLQTQAKKKTWSDKETQKDRELAKRVGLTLIQFRVLRALAGDQDGGMSYRDIERKTGYYPMLASILQPHIDENSLGAKGLTRSVTIESDAGREVVAFVITSKGRKLLDKTKASKD